MLQLTNAIKNGLKQSPPGAHKNNPMGISMSSSPHQAGNISKCAITNASFRAKKLPGMLYVQCHTSVWNGRRVALIDVNKCISLSEFTWIVLHVNIA